MPRWRDVKHGKISAKSKKTEEKNSINYAKISDRLKAFLTDTFMITMPIMYIVIYLVMGSREEFKAHMGMGWVYILIPHFLIVVSFWTLKGQTPGMKAYNIKLISKSGKNPNFFQSTIRYFFMPISIISIIGMILAFLKKDKQTFYDFLSRTIIIEENSEK